MHAETGKGFNVRVAMMDTMNKCVEKLSVNESMRQVKMNISNHWNCQTPKEEVKHVLRSVQTAELQFASPIAVQKGGLGKGPLNNSQGCIPGIVKHFAPFIGSIGDKGSLAPAEAVQRDVPKSNIGQNNDVIDQETFDQGFFPARL